MPVSTRLSVVGLVKAAHAVAMENTDQKRFTATARRPRPRERMQGARMQGARMQGRERWQISADVRWPGTGNSTQPTRRESGSAG